ncbi:MAG TPA: diacylglycerol kinase family protein [Holophaga sp.]|nr:diacylglycerol kinase family protein [Holophaga sp.]
MKLPLVFNPRSGPRGADPEALLARLAPALRAAVIPVPFGPPWDWAPFIDQAAKAGGPLLVWGGDGTIHHAGRALVAAGCPVPLAAIPGGSGNGLVRGLRTPLAPAAALAALLSGRELRMDLPRLDGVPFLNVCGTGFEAAIAHAFDAAGGRGLRTYVQLCLRLWRTHPVAGLAWEGEAGGLPPAAWSLCFANLPQYGSGFWIAPGADPTDGVLQWVTLRRPGTADLLLRSHALLREKGRTTLRQEGRLKLATLRLEQPLPWHLDGEPAAPRDRAELTLEPRAFRMQVAKACPWS